MEIEKDLEQLSLKIMRNLQLQGKHNILQGYRNKSPVADLFLNRLRASIDDD